MTFSQFISNPGKVLISIHAVTEKGQPVKVTTTDMLTREPIIIAETYVDTNGMASFEIPLKNVVFASLQIGEQRSTLLVSPGDQLQVALDSKNASTPFHYTGKGAEASNYLTQSGMIYRQYERRGGVPLTALDPEAFFGRLDSLQRSYTDLTNQFKAFEALPGPIQRLLEERNRLQLLTYQINYSMAKFNPKDSTGKSLADLKSYISKVPLDSSLLEAQLPEYAMALLFYLQVESQWPLVMGKAREEVVALRDKLPLLSDQLIQNQSYPAAIKTFLRAKNIETLLTRQGVNAVADSLMVSLKKEPGYDTYAPSLEKKYRKWQPLATGQMAPNFSGTTPEGKVISLSDLKGKVVYIDVWATWCQPCLEELPIAKVLQKQFETNNQVAFMYVSVDKNESAWRKRLTKEKEFMGLHINQPTTETGEPFLNTYQLYSIPRYILVDQEGKLVNVNAPAPSSGKVGDELIRLLKKL